MSYIRKNELFLFVRNLNLFIYFFIIKYLFSSYYMAGIAPDSRALQERLVLISYLSGAYLFKKGQMY